MWGFLTALAEFLGLVAKAQKEKPLTPEGIQEAEANSEQMEKDKFSGS